MVTKEVITPTKFVGILLALLYEKNKAMNKETILPSDKVKLHSTFYELGKTNEEIFSVLEFDTRKAHPYSLSLDEAFANIQASNALSRRNPPMIKFEVHPSIKSYKERFDKNKVKDLEKIADQLASKL